MAASVLHYNGWTQVHVTTRHMEYIEYGDADVNE